MRAFHTCYHLAPVGHVLVVAGPAHYPHAASLGFFHGRGRHGCRIVIAREDDRDAHVVGLLAESRGKFDPRFAPLAPTRKPVGSPRPVSRSATAPASQYTMPLCAAAELAGTDRADEYAPRTVVILAECRERMTDRACAGVSSSRVSRTIARPWMPPAAFTSSCAIRMPRYSWRASGLMDPDSGKTAPIRIVPPRMAWTCRGAAGRRATPASAAAKKDERTRGMDKETPSVLLGPWIPR